MKTVIKTILSVSLFAVAMAYLESTIVVYLRHIYGITDLLKDIPTEPDKYTTIEIGREFCTLLILFLVGWLTGKKWQIRIGYMLFAFGIWDIFYYIWLYVFIGWPTSLKEWDILFLIPLPWWGPVLAPVLIAILMISGGLITVLKSFEKVTLNINYYNYFLLILSILIVLYVFMKDAIDVLPGGIETISKVKPTVFNWWLFLAAYSGMSYFVYRIFSILKKGK